MTRLAWFHCFSGIAGDMALGSLLDAGADVDEVRSMVERLPVHGWRLEAEPVLRCGIAATKAHVHAEETTVVRTASHIAALVEEARLPERVRRRALAVFAALADAEGRLHRRPPEQVHFHEVGGLDAIVDVVGTCSALEVLDIDIVYALGGRHRHRAWCGPPTACSRTRRRRWSSCSPASAPPPAGIDLGVELTTPTGRRARSPRSRRASGRCRR